MPQNPSHGRSAKEELHASAFPRTLIDSLPSEERYRAVVEQTADGIFLIDGATKSILEANSRFEELLGYGHGELHGISLYDLVPHDREGARANVDRVLEQKSYQVGERSYRRKDGSLVDVEVSASVIGHDDKEILCCVARDITERKRAEERLRESEEHHRAVVEQSVEGIYLFDPDSGRVLESNGAFEELVGYTADELLGMTIYDLIAHESEDIDWQVERSLEEKRRHKGERSYRRKDGSSLEVEASATVVPYGEEEAVCCVIHDVSERKKLEERLEHQAFHDSLTDLPNRALFLDRLGHALAQTGREDGPVAVLLLDLNHFKMVNDSLGHDAGNVVLVGVAERLRASVRPGDTVGRIFGDEFAVLLGAPSGMDEARRVAGRIQERLEGPFEVEAQEVLVSPSIGISLGYSAQDRPEEVLRQADLAMYTAKKRGKAECEEYSPAMEAQVAERADLEQDLRRAVEREEFEAHYQPIVELHNGEIVGVEALARWRHPERGLVEAAEFIETAEETGLIRPIGRRVIEEACRQAKEWRQRYPQNAPMLSVNLSVNQFVQQPDLIPKVLDETGLEPSALQVESTERAVMDDAEFALVELKELKDLGVSLAIDDFGMGYSCLYHLKHMPIDFLKIDRAFIAGLGDDQGDEAIVSGTVSLAHALGVIAVAEGVETADQQEILRELGCDLAQGYYLTKPLSREDMEKLLADGASY
jgi:diguanylate cyclase (GGDEF)-like protein/PAS domain S-box-containing protein